MNKILNHENGKGIVELAEDNKLGKQGFTPVVVILSIIAFLVTIVLIARGLFAIGPWIDTDTMPSATGLLCVLPVLAVIAIYKRWTGRVLMTNAQILTLYCIVTLGGVVMGGMSFFTILGSTMTLQSLVSGNDVLYAGMEGSFQPMLDVLPSFVIPQGEAVVNGFFIGNAAVPWGSWIMPIILWTLYWSAMFFVFVCITALLHRNWSEELRYSYPVTKGPLALVAGIKSESGKQIPFWSNRIMWLGAAVPLLVHFWNSVMTQQFGVPQIALSWIYEASAGQEGFIHGFFWVWPGFRWVVNFMVIGLGYFISGAVLFSYWFFHIFGLCLGRGLVRTFGLSALGHFNIVYMVDQMTVGMIMIGVISLYMGRHQIQKVWNKFRGADSGHNVDDRTEPLPYRLVPLALAVSLLFILFFNIVMLKISFWSILILGTVLLLVVIGFARSRAEVGIPYSIVSSPMFSTWLPLVVPGTMIGSSFIRAAGFHCAVGQGTFGSTMALASESYKIGDDVGTPRRNMTKALLFTVPVALLIAFVVGLVYNYEYGNTNIAFTFQHITRLEFGQTHQIMFPAAYPEGTTFSVLREWDPYRPFAIVAIAIFVTFLWFMRGLLTWWPFHPIGYVLGVQVWSSQYWSSLFLAWLIKLIIVRYRGADGLIRAKPFFLGLIVGSVLWKVIELIFNSISLMG